MHHQQGAPEVPSRATRKPLKMLKGGSSDSVYSKAKDVNEPVYTKLNETNKSEHTYSSGKGSTYDTPPNRASDSDPYAILKPTAAKRKNVKRASRNKDSGNPYQILEPTAAKRKNVASEPLYDSVNGDSGSIKAKTSAPVAPSISSLKRIVDKKAQGGTKLEASQDKKPGTIKKVYQKIKNKIKQKISGVDKFGNDKSIDTMVDLKSVNSMPDSGNMGNLVMKPIAPRSEAIAKEAADIAQKKDRAKEPEYITIIE